MAQGQSNIYAINRLNHTYEFVNFNSISSLYYFADQIEHGDESGLEILSQIKPEIELKPETELESELEPELT